MATVAATRLRDRSILLASAFCVLCSLLFLGVMPAGTPVTMLFAAKSAMMIGLLGLRAAAGLFDREDDETVETDDGR